MDNINQALDRMAVETGLPLVDILDVYQIFFDSFSIDELDHQLALKSYTGISRLSHQLKGTASNLRMDIVSSLAEELNEAAANEDIHACAAISQKIGNEINNVKNLMEAKKKQ